MNFAQATKYLDITPTTRDTTVNTKPFNVQKARAIRKVFKKFTLDAYSQSTLLIGAGRFGWQYNISMPEAFRITNYGSLDLAYFNFGSIAIRYRVGTDVTRYVLYRRSGDRALFDPIYTGQEIGANCVVELWNTTLGAAGAFGLYTAKTFITNLAENPDDADDTGTVYTADAREQSALFHTQPEDIPTPYGEESAWLDNA